MQSAPAQPYSSCQLQDLYFWGSELTRSPDSHSNHAHSRSHSQATINQTAPQQRPPPISSGLSGFLGSAQIGRRKHSTRPSKSSDITITPLSHSDQENNSASKTENGVENAVGDAFGPPFTTSGLQGDSSSSANTPSRGGKSSSQVDVVANATPATPAAARSSIVTSTSTVTGVAIDPLSQVRMNFGRRYSVTSAFFTVLFERARALSL